MFKLYFVLNGDRAFIGEFSSQSEAENGMRNRIKRQSALANFVNKLDFEIIGDEMIVNYGAVNAYYAIRGNIKTHLVTPPFINYKYI